MDVYVKNAKSFCSNCSEKSNKKDQADKHFSKNYIKKLDSEFQNNQPNADRKIITSSFYRFSSNDLYQKINQEKEAEKNIDDNSSPIKERGNRINNTVKMNKNFKLKFSAPNKEKKIFNRLHQCEEILLKHSQNIIQKKISEKNELKNLGKCLIRDISNQLNLKKEVIGYIRSNKTSLKNILNRVESNIKLKNYNNQEQNIVSSTNSEENFEKLKKNNSMEKNNYVGLTDLKDSKDSRERTIGTIPKLSMKRLKSHKKTLIKKDSIDDEEIDKNDIIPSPILINHESTYKVTWDLITCSIIIYTIIMTPFYFCFYNEVIILNIIEIIFEVYFVIDTLLNFLTTFTDHEENLIINLNEISYHYITSWFFYDILFTIPYELISYVTSAHQFSCLLSYLKWLKVLRMGKFFRAQSLGRFFDNLLDYDNQSFKRVLNFGFFFIFITHISTCFFLYLGLEPINNSSWLIKSEIDFRILEMYIASLYYNLVTIYSIGYGDITPTNIKERIWVSLFMIAGSMLYSYAVTLLSNIFFEKNNKYMEYKKKKSIISSINMECQIPDYLDHKIRQCIKKSYKKNESDRFEFLDSLPSKIKSDLTMVMYESTINHHKFFHNQPNDFILDVLPKLKHENLAKGDTLISVGSIIEEMYFVLKGGLSINMGSQYDNIEVGQIVKSNHFGDLLIHLNIQSPYEIKCKRNSTEIFILKKNDFLKLKNSYSSNVYDILDESSQNLVFVDKKRQLCIELFKYYKNSADVKKKMRLIDLYLFEKGFNDYYDYELDFENPTDFLINNKEEDVKELVDTICEKMKQYKNLAIPKKEELSENTSEDNFIILSGNNINNEIEGAKELNKSCKFKSQKSLKLNTNIQKSTQNILFAKPKKNIKSMKNDFKSIYNTISKLFSQDENQTREEIINQKTLEMFSIKEKKFKNTLLYRNRSIKRPRRSMTANNLVFNRESKKLIKRNTILKENRFNNLTIQKTVNIHLLNNNDKSLILNNRSSFKFIIPTVAEENLIIQASKKKSNNEITVNKYITINNSNHNYNLIQNCEKKQHKTLPSFYKIEENKIVKEKDELCSPLKRNSKKIRINFEQSLEKDSDVEKEDDMRLDHIINLLEKFCVKKSDTNSSRGSYTDVPLNINNLK